MKAENFILHTEFIRENAIAFMNRIALDGKTKVTFSSAGNKSAKQRGLDWRWNTDVADSGMGGKFEDTKDNVHRVCKFKWAIPIFIRDDPFFAELYEIYTQLYNNDPERMKWFIDRRVHTEEFNVSQMAEYLTDKQRHYLGLGFPLTDPDDLKLLYYGQAKFNNS